MVIAQKRETLEVVNRSVKVKHLEGLMQTISQHIAGECHDICE